MQGDYMNSKVFSFLLVAGYLSATSLTALTPIGSRLPPAGYNLDPDKDKINTWNRTTYNKDRGDSHHHHHHHSKPRVYNNYYYPYYSTYGYPYSGTYYSSPYGYPYVPHEAFPDDAAADELFERLSD